MDDLVMDEATMLYTERLRSHLLDLADDEIGLALAAAVAWKREEAGYEPKTDDDYSLVMFLRKQAEEKKVQHFYRAWGILKMVCGESIEVNLHPARMPGFTMLRERTGRLDRDTLEQLESRAALHRAGATRQLLTTMFTVTAPGFDLDEGRRMMEALQ
jgi:hypothetical protein